MSLRKFAFTVGGFTFLSRITGFVRDILVAAMLGAGPLADVFFVAFKLPNFFRRLFAEGAFNAAFIPLFSGVLTSKGKKQAKEFAGKVFSVMVFSLLVFVILMEIAMPVVMAVLAPGFTANPEQFDLAVALSRITFPYLFFISLVALFTGVLNSVDRFGPGASAPILLNLCLIGAILGLDEYTETPAHALSWGVFIAGIAQFLWLLYSAKRAGMLLKFGMPKLSKEVKKVLKLMGPGIVGAGIVQINLWIDIVIGTLIPGAISYLYYADRINQLPLAVVGTAIGTALLPMLSKQLREKKKKKALDTQNRALELALFFTIPAAIALMVIPLPIIAALFERGEFSAQDSLAASFGLTAYALGLPAFVLIKVFTPSFFAVQDVKTPVKIASLCLVINLVCNLSFVFTLKHYGFYPHIGIAFATSIAAWVNALLLARILKARKAFQPDEQLKSTIQKTLFAACVMAFVLVFYQLTYSTVSADQFERVMIMLVVVTLGAGAFFATAYATGVVNNGRLKKLLKR